MIKTYSDALNFLFASTSVYERDGIAAYKPGLTRINELSSVLNHPCDQYDIIHVAGTNGKGTVCHTLAAILQKSGLRTGLYTSPHLVDFSERIRVDGKTIEEDFVIDFVRTYGGFQSSAGNCSFFEFTTAMAFDYFRRMKVDVAVVETGLGGRLDSTNIVTPILSIITSISSDHTDILGTTLKEIATEKAGIIKTNVPVVVGNGISSPIRKVFIEVAEQKNAPIYIVEDMDLTKTTEKFYEQDRDRVKPNLWQFQPELRIHNILTIFMSLQTLKERYPSKFSDVRVRSIFDGFTNVTGITGLRGRWEEIELMERLMVVDIAHNIGAWNANRLLIEKLFEEARGRLHIVVGFCKDKKLSQIFSWLPATARYHFVAANAKRALPAKDVAVHARRYGRKGKIHGSVAAGILDAIDRTKPGDIILISGSAYIAGEALTLIDKLIADEELAERPPDITPNKYS